MNARSCLRAARGLLAVALLGVLTPWSAGAREAVRAGRGEITLPTYPWWPPIKHPYFRGTDNRNIYPYPMLDQLRREKAPRTYQTVTLENEYLRVTLLPELGGKVHEVISKVTGQPVFYVNHVVKPGLIGQCGAWISGGIEWNTGPQGHTVSCLQPVDVQVLPAEADGSRSVAIGETERIYRTKWTVVLTLRPGRSFLEERIRIYNPTETVRPYYFWNCTAAPNTPGFRFVYPMTLGTDHGGTQFYAWPIHEGKDLRQGTNYQDASSIFAYGCDQDFFGSYNDDLRRGVVAYANHHQLPGKKAWTWGWGSYGTMHQMDLTDDDGPYNEVQTGPLLTQADVGQLDPGEAVAWREWWYPVHELGGFTYANRDLAVNAEPEAGRYRLRFLGTGTWSPVTVTLSNANYTVARNLGRISPRQPTELKVDVPGDPGPIWVSVDCRGSSLARFRVPLDLPTPTKPEPTAPPASASGLARSGWQDFLFARFAEAETRFRDATAKDPAAVEAWTGLAHLRLDADPAQAAAHARTALSHNPDDGPARFALAVAEFRQHRETEALEAAWRAALDPRTAVPGRALAAKILIRQQHYASAIAALSESGPWTHDNLCRNRLAFAQLAAGNQREAVRLASQSLAEDPLDAFAQSLLATLKPKGSGKTAPAFARIEPATALDLAAEYSELGAPATALRVLTEGYVGIRWEGRTLDPLPFYWAGYLASRLGQEAQALQWLQKARAQRPDGVFPHHYEAVPVLEYALARQPDDAQAALLLGHLLFHLGRYAPAQAHWEQAAAGNAAPVVAARALGMAKLSLAKDNAAAIQYLGQAHQLDPADPIVARDLARVLFALADQASDREEQLRLIERVRDTLKAAFADGRSRSDFVALLARAQNRLGDYAETARLLDSVRITIWEGAREAHDLFEEAHLALGSDHLKAGRPAEALAEFDRALEYPANLATGRLENTPEAHIQYLRGNALAALGRNQQAREAWTKAANEPSTRDPKKEEARRAAQAALDQR